MCTHMDAHTPGQERPSGPTFCKSVYLLWQNGCRCSQHGRLFTLYQENYSGQVKFFFKCHLQKGFQQTFNHVQTCTNAHDHLLQTSRLKMTALSLQICHHHHQFTSLTPHTFSHTPPPHTQSGYTPRILTFLLIRGNTHLPWR